MDRSDTVHRRRVDRPRRGAFAADREAEEGDVTSSLNTGGRNYREFGRDVDDIIADVIQVGSPANQTPLEAFVRKRFAEIMNDLRDRKLTSEMLDEMAGAVGETTSIASVVPLQWVMFAEPAREGAEFLGVYITRALSFEHAVLRAHVLGLSPGGRADGAALPLGLPIDPDYCDRLLTFREAQALRDVLDGMYN
ncbi:hypothetical protein [uncultured Brevundimonas sp.]|uniref:hypothetical protein n=1 Tax=uncultured Brevundimonas sp. TaxID=213418 RepID=UPI0025EC5407|nr:hypothetical protein [uncultured Brevundimonas sp.]